MSDDLNAAASDLSLMFDAAVEAYRLFGAFRVGGFTEDQALKLTAYVMVGQVGDSTP